jgi:hypothetical protein
MIYIFISCRMLTSIITMADVVVGEICISSSTYEEWDTLVVDISTNQEHMYTDHNTVFQRHRVLWYMFRDVVTTLLHENRWLEAEKVVARLDLPPTTMLTNWSSVYTLSLRLGAVGVANALVIKHNKADIVAAHMATYALIKQNELAMTTFRALRPCWTAVHYRATITTAYQRAHIHALRFFHQQVSDDMTYYMYCAMNHNNHRTIPPDERQCRKECDVYARIFCIDVRARPDEFVHTVKASDGVDEVRGYYTKSETNVLPVMAAASIGHNLFCAPRWTPKTHRRFPKKFRENRISLLLLVAQRRRNSVVTNTILPIEMWHKILALLPHPYICAK